MTVHRLNISNSQSVVRNLIRQAANIEGLKHPPARWSQKYSKIASTLRRIFHIMKLKSLWQPQKLWNMKLIWISHRADSHIKFWLNPIPYCHGRQEFQFQFPTKKSYDVSWELKWFHRKSICRSTSMSQNKKWNRKFPKIQFNSCRLVISSIYAALSLMNKLCESTEACSNIHKLRNEINNGNFIIY